MVMLLMLLVIIGAVVIGGFIYLFTRHGENCPGYPYNCPCCPRAAKCIIEIGRKDK